MLRRLERELKAKDKGRKSSSAAPLPIGGPTPSQQHQPPPIQTTFQPQQQHSLHQAAQQQQQPPPLDFPSDHPHAHAHPSSLNSGSSGVGSTPTHVFEMPFQVTYPSSDTRQTERDSMGESTPDADDQIYPARVVDKESKRHSFFRIILNPSDKGDNSTAHGEPPKTDAERAQATLSPSRPVVLDPNVQDPIAIGLLDEQEAKVLFDL
jgi:hypothetical protein